MFTLSRLAEALLMPPGSLFWLFPAVLGALATGKRWAVVAVAAVGLTALALFSFHPFADALLGPLEDRFPPEADLAGEAFGAVVVLGGGTVEPSPDALAVPGGFPSRATLSPDALKRAVYAATLAADLDLPLFVTGGRSPYRPQADSEAEVTAAWLSRLTGGAGEVVLEEESTSTWENAGNLAAMTPPQPVVLVTSAYHMPRSMLAFAVHGLRAVPAPTDYKAQARDYAFTDLLPSAAALEKTRTAAREYLGLAIYSMRSLLER